MIRNGSSLFSLVTKLSNRTGNPLYIRYFSMNQRMEITKALRSTEEIKQSVLTRNSFKSELKSENVSSMFNPEGTRSSTRCKYRKVDSKLIESQEKVTFVSEDSNHTNSDLATHKKKRSVHQKRVFTQDSCQRQDMKLKHDSNKTLKKEVKFESDLSLKEEKQLKTTSRGKNKSSNTRKIVKSESQPTTNHKYVGAHLSIAGGLYKCIDEAVRIGARSCGLFLKSQRQWASKPLTEDTIQKFKDTIQKNNFPVDKLLPHGSYLLNCGSPDDQTLEKSRTALIDELQRCELLGIPLYNFHPGSSCGKISRDECIDKIGESINLAHSQTDYVITVIENMSCQGNTIGGKLEELKSIINKVKDKTRIGVCIDTCHAFAAGYDVSTEPGFKLFMQQLEDIVGLQYLKAVHLNDSKGKLGCHLDRHENIGKGNIGINGFKLVMREPSFNNLPMILETPMELSDEEEIKILNSL